MPEVYCSETGGGSLISCRLPKKFPETGAIICGTLVTSVSGKRSKRMSPTGSMVPCVRLHQHAKLATILPLVLLCLASLAASGQVLAGSLTGSVTDPTDAAIPNAAVIVTDLSTGREYKTTSDQRGEFSFPNVANGLYKVQVEAPGFSKAVIERVQVFVSQAAHVNAKLEVGSVDTLVVVSAEQSVVQTESAEIKNSVDRVQNMNLPLPTRNPLDLVRIMAGKTSATPRG